MTTTTEVVKAVKVRNKRKVVPSRIRLDAKDAVVIKQIREAEKCYIKVQPFKNNERPVFLEVTKQSLIEQLRLPLAYGAELSKVVTEENCLFIE